jgi:surface antigen
MTNKETIDRWAEQIIPVVFRAEDALQKAKPEWKERLAKLGQPGGEDPHKVAKEYCREIAHIIVTQGSDYVPDGTIDGEADYT